MHMHVCGLLVLEPASMDGDPYDHIEAMVQGALSKVPLMRKRLATVPFGLARPFWVDDADFDLGHHLRRVRLSPRGDERELAAVVGDLTSRPLDRSRPLWEVWFIDGLAGGRVALLAKMHHSTIDGIEGVSVMARLLDVGAPQPRDGADGRSAFTAEAPPNRLELLRRGLGQRLGAPLDVARLLPATVGRIGATLWHLGTHRDGAEGDGRPTVAPFTAPRTAFNATLTPRRSIAIVDVSLSDVKALKDAHGVKVNDVLTAVVGGALRRYLLERGELPDRPLVAAVPMSVHGRTGTVRGVTKLSVLFTTMGSDVEDPLERLRRVAGGNARAKEVSGAMGADTFTRWANQFWPNALALGARLYSVLHMAEHHPVVCNLVLSNVAGPPGELSLAGARVVGTYAFGPLIDGAGLNVTVISAGDRVGFGIVTCPDLLPDVEALAAAIPGELDALTRATSGLERAR